MYGGFATYDSDAKGQFLGVRVGDVYTKECSLEMAIGAITHARALVGVAVTGKAGPVVKDDLDSLGVVDVAASVRTDVAGPGSDLPEDPTFPQTFTSVSHRIDACAADGHQETRDLCDKYKIEAAAGGRSARLAPGRVFLGIGTGHTAMRVMGMRPMKPKAFREYLRVVRALLDGQEVEYTHGDETRAICFLQRERNFIDLDHRIPIWVAANGAGALRAAGAYGDGRISALDEPPDMLRNSLVAIDEGARQVGRTVPDEFHTAALTTACVLRPGETLRSERVIDQCGSQVAAALHYAWEAWRTTGDDHIVPPHVRDLFGEYCAYVAAIETPEHKRYLQVHRGHCSFLVPEERRFIRPEAIQTWVLAGKPDEVIERIRQAEAAGLREVTLLPPTDHHRDVFRDVAEHVMRAY